MVEPAKNRMHDNVSEPLDRACAGRVLPERNVSSHFIIIGGIFRQNSPQVLCVEHDQMISAFTSDRPDQALNISVLPGRAERGGPIPDTHRSHASFERDAKCSVIIANEILRCAVPRKRFGDLARQPLGRRISGHCKPGRPSFAITRRGLRRLISLWFRRLPLSNYSHFLFSATAGGGCCGLR